MLDVARGEAAKVVPAGVGLALAAAVVVPCVGRTVIRVAVDLDGQVMLGPAEVDAVRAGGAVGIRAIEALGSQEVEHASFQRALGNAYFAMDDRASLRRARALRVQRENGLDLVWRGAVPDVGLMERASKVVGG